MKKDLETKLNDHYQDRLSRGEITNLDHSYGYKLGSDDAFALSICDVSNQRELLIAFAGWLYGNLDKDIEEKIVDDYLKSN